MACTVSIRNERLESLYIGDTTIVTAVTVSSQIKETLAATVAAAGANGAVAAANIAAAGAADNVAGAADDATV